MHSHSPSTLPCSDYIEIRGMVFFARMLSKIRLRQQGLLPADYELGTSSPTCFDARFCRFWNVDYEQIKSLTLAGKSDEAIFDAIFEGRTLNPEHVLCWNSFITKRGWRDGVSGELERLKLAEGLEGRTDVQTFVDFHDVDEGRSLRYS